VTAERSPAFRNFLKSLHAKGRLRLEAIETSGLAGAERDEAEAMLLKALPKDERAADALADLGSERGAEAIAARLPRTGGFERISLAYALHRLAGFPEGEEILLQGTCNSNHYTRNHAIHLMHRCPSPRVWRRLFQVIREDDDRLCRMSAFLQLMHHAKVIDYYALAGLLPPELRALYTEVASPTWPTPPWDGAPRQVLDTILALLRERAPDVAAALEGAR
jgi:hypothetical protein